MAATFSLVRHGAYDAMETALGGRAGHGLSEAGRAQARHAGAQLRARRAVALISSPVVRAYETAALIGAEIDLPVRTEPAFSEIAFAGWTGMSFDALRDDEGWHNWNAFRSAAGVPGGERMFEVQCRAIGAVCRVAGEHDGGEIVVVSHADVIKSVLAYLLGMPLDLLRRLEVGPCSISRFTLRDEDATVTAVNLPASYPQRCP